MEATRRRQLLAVQPHAARRMVASTFRTRQAVDRAGSMQSATRPTTRAVVLFTLGRRSIYLNSNLWIKIA